MVVKRLTYADYARIPSDGCRHEIIGGEEFVTPAPNTNHQRIVVRLLRLVAAHVDAGKLGEVLVAPADVLLSKHDVVQPDVLFVSRERASIVTPANIKGAPDLVIEVLSPTTAPMDRSEKLALYERAGVREYWIVDPQGQTVEVREFGSPRRTRVYKAGQSVASAVLPGLALNTDDIF